MILPTNDRVESLKYWNLVLNWGYWEVFLSVLRILNKGCAELDWTYQTGQTRLGRLDWTKLHDTGLEMKKFFPVAKLKERYGIGKQADINRRKYLGLVPQKIDGIYVISNS